MDTQILKKIENLPTSLQKEVSDFVDFLIFKTKKKVEIKEDKKRKFGSAKGMITMSDDFDEPLEDFKDYM